MSNHKPRIEDLALTRREMLERCANGFGAVALAGLLADDAEAATKAAPKSTLRNPQPAIDPLAPKPGHFPAKAKSVIFLFMDGGPSQVDTFDPKPLLDRYHGKPLPATNLRTERKTGAAMRSPFRFRR